MTQFKDKSAKQSRRVHLGRPAHLPGPAGRRHPALRRRLRARGRRPAPAHRAHPRHRHPVQPPLRRHLRRARGRHPRRRGAGDGPPGAHQQDVEVGRLPQGTVLRARPARGDRQRSSSGPSPTPAPTSCYDPADEARRGQPAVDPGRRHRHHAAGRGRRLHAVRRAEGGHRRGRRGGAAAASRSATGRWRPTPPRWPGCSPSAPTRPATWRPRPSSGPTATSGSCLPAERRAVERLAELGASARRRSA